MGDRAKGFREPAGDGLADLRQRYVMKCRGRNGRNGRNGSNGRSGRDGSRRLEIPSDDSPAGAGARNRGQINPSLAGETACERGGFHA